MEHDAKHPSRLRVLVAHEDAIVAFGLRASLEPRDDLLVQLGAPTPAAGLSCDVVICDHRTGLAMAKLPPTAKAAAPARAPRVLVYGHAVGDQPLRQALQGGIQGYVHPGCAPDELAHALYCVASGRRFVSAALALQLAASLSHTELTAREREVLDWLCAGHCNKSIARALGISVATVKAHVQSIMGKLDAGSRTQVVRVALQRGLVQPGEPPMAGGAARGSERALAA